jgi:hypothetical protein
MLLGAGFNLSMLYEPGVRFHLSDMLSRARIFSSGFSGVDTPVRSMPPPAASDTAFISLAAALVADAGPAVDVDVLLAATNVASDPASTAAVTAE